MACAGRVSSEPLGTDSVDLGKVKIVLHSVFYETDFTLNALLCFRLDEQGDSIMITESRCLLNVKLRNGKRLEDARKRDVYGLHTVWVLRTDKNHISVISIITMKKHSESRRKIKLQNDFPHKIMVNRNSIAIHHMVEDESLVGSRI